MMEEFADVTAWSEFMATREGISPIERLLNEFEAHEAKEDDALEFYKNTLAHMPSPLTRFLLQLVVSDEEKHRAVVHAMVSTLKGSLTWTRPPDSLENTGAETGSTKELRNVTDELIRLEKDGIAEYKALVKASSGYYRGVFKILLDSMIRDSEKHVELLEFLKQTLKEP
jgi:rubrerythrin